MVRRANRKKTSAMNLVIVPPRFLSGSPTHGLSDLVRRNAVLRPDLFGDCGRDLYVSDPLTQGPGLPVSSPRLDARED